MWMEFRYFKWCICFCKTVETTCISFLRHELWVGNNFHPYFSMLDKIVVKVLEVTEGHRIGRDVWKEFWLLSVSLEFRHSLILRKKLGNESRDDLIKTVCYVIIIYFSFLHLSSRKFLGKYSECYGGISRDIMK